MSIIVGIDVGGTFTDFVLWEDGKRTIHKVLSTHPYPEIGVVDGLNELGVLHYEGCDDTSAGAVEARKADIIHGSTIATNALLERKGAKVALITTEGFADIIYIARQNRPQLYNLYAETPEPLVAEDCVFEIAERIGSRGEVLQALDTSTLNSVVRRLKDRDVDAVAICFLFSFLNASHERLVEHYLEDNGFFVSASYRVLPEYREYERFSTTVINAFVTPLVANYLGRLSHGLGAESGRSLRIMQSNGGLTSAGSAAKQAVTTVLSGPAGGVVACGQLGKATGINKLISFDMGGTSTDVSLIDGAIQLTTEFSLYGLPIKVPMADIHTIGAGGGSIAWVDEGGALQVGPGSAGSNPGPASYGRGELPTITDANVVLGRLHPDYFLGGKQKLDIMNAQSAIEKLAETCGLDRISVANGVIRIATSNMQRAVQKISVERGFDPRDFTLVAFGGAGPMHACELAEASLIPRVLIPQTPGVFSALGMTVSDMARDYSKSVLKRQGELNGSVLKSLFAPVSDEAREYLLGEGFSHESIKLEKTLDIRYLGQSFELMVPLRDFDDNYISAFHRAHKERYGHADEREEIEVVALRVRAIGWRNKPVDPVIAQASEPAQARLYTQIFFNGWQEAPCYERENLLCGHIIAGPALVFQLDSTVVIPPSWRAEVDVFGNLLLERVFKGAGNKYA